MTRHARWQHGDVTRADIPRPEEASTAAEYVALLKQLRLWSGLTYRQLDGKAKANGEVLPASTTATMLNRGTLPREQLVAAFTRACGLDESDVERWLLARRRIAVATPDAEAPAPPPRRKRRTWWLVAAAVTVVVAAATAVTIALNRPSDDVPALPANGWYQLRPAHTAERDLCVGEGRERNKRTDRPLAVQRPCEGLVPDTYLEAVGSGVYLIKWSHPEEGWGCLTVDEALLEDGALLAPENCTSAAHQRFLFEPVRIPAPNGFVLRPVHSGKCVGLLFGPADVDAGAELTQATCSGKADQEFLLEAVER